MKKENTDVTNHLRRLKLLNRLFIFLLFLHVGFMATLFADDGYYVCSNDQVYRDYKNGLVSNLEGANKYSTELLCSYDCNQYETCSPSKVYSTETTPVFNCIDAIKARELQNYFSTQKFQTVNFKSMGVPVWGINFETVKNGDEFIFPHAFDAPNDMSAWDNNGTSVRISKDSTNYIEIAMTIEGNNEHNVSGVIYKGDKTYSIKGVVNGTATTYKCGLFDNTGMMVDYENQLELITNADTFYCPLRKSENIGGEYNNGSNFQNQSDCNSVCTVKNECVQVADNACKSINIQYSQPVTDYTGKAVYTKRAISYECNNTITKTVGCANWKVVTNQGTVDVNMTEVGTVFKNRADTSKDASILARMLEEQLHIFTGWKGECDKGKLFNNPFSDPFKLLGYAMMVYSSSAKVDTGTTDANGAVVYDYPMGETMSNVHDSFDNAAEGFKSGWSSITKELLNSGTSSTDTSMGDYIGRLAESDASISKDLADVGSSGIISSVEDIASTVTDYINTPLHTIDLGIINVPMYVSDYIKLGMALIPTKEELVTANNFNKAWLGDTDSDSQSVAYATCMASIGLSAPNLISYAASDLESTSKELAHPWDNPIRLSYSQIQYLAGATSEKFVKEMYFYVSDNPSGQYITLAAKNSQAYFQAGQVICAGKLAIANNANTVSLTTTSSGSEGGGVGEAVAMFAIKKLLAMLPPPYNLIATILLDLIMAFDSIDACGDIDDATKMGTLQMKTNRFINFDQCYSTETKCKDKFLGKCILKRHYHCCYDQISTRIFAEGIKEQLGLERNNCNNITLEHLKEISFRKCTPTENAYKDKCFPANKWDEYQAAISAQGVTNLDASALVQMGINSLGVSNALQCK